MFFKKSGSKPPALTPRQRLVGDMQQAYPSVRAADAQGSAYEMALRPGGVPMTLRIVLDAAFPATKPDIQVYASVPISHPQIDPRTKQIINMPKLAQWQQATSSLVDVLNEVIALCNALGTQMATRGGGLATTGPAVAGTASTGTTTGAGGYAGAYLSSGQANQLPPPPAYNSNGGRPAPLYTAASAASNASFSSSTSSLPPMTPSGSAAAAGGSSFSSSATTAAAAAEAVETHHTPMPEVPLHFPELNAMTEAQLERLLNDEAALKAHMKTVGSVELMASMRDELRESNLQKILEALELEKEMDALSRQCQAGKRALQEEADAYNKLFQELKRTHSVSKEMIIQELSQKVNACDERSEALGQDFVDGQKSMQTFLQEYLEARKQYYILNAKLESVKRS